MGVFLSPGTSLKKKNKKEEEEKNSGVAWRYLPQ
jgi:hypothetical protein